MLWQPAWLLRGLLLRRLVTDSHHSLDPQWDLLGDYLSLLRVYNQSLHYSWSLSNQCHVSTPGPGNRNFNRCFPTYMGCPQNTREEATKYANSTGRHDHGGCIWHTRTRCRVWWFYGTTPAVLWNAHWAIPTGGLVLVGLGVNEIAYTLSGYLTDTYTVYSASAFAGLAFVCALVSGIMPLIGYVIFDGHQSMVPGFVIAGVATAFCVVRFSCFGLGGG